MKNADAAPILIGHHHAPPNGTQFQQGDSGREIVATTEFDYPDDETDRGNPMAGFGKERGMKVAAVMLESITHWLGESKTTNACGIRGLAFSWLLRRSMFSESTQRQFCANRKIPAQQFNRALGELRAIANGQFRVSDRMWPEESRDSLRSK